MKKKMAIRVICSSTAVLLALGATADTSRFTWASGMGGGISDGPIVDSDPFLGDWEGKWTTDKGQQKSNPFLAAQVIPRGNDTYHVNFIADFDMRCVPYAIVEAHRDGNVLRFDEAGWKGAFEGDRGAGDGDMKGSVGTFELKKVTRLPKTLGLKPPAGAVVLFDGDDFDQWRPDKDVANNWQLAGGAMIPGMVEAKNRHGLETKRGFGDCTLHIEFNLPLEPENTAQGRGNSGVFLGAYEVQVLDSYGLVGFYNECGALYKLAAPMVNMCAPPLQWQTYDIEYRAPRFDAAGKLTENPRMTVVHNGVLIHKDVDLVHHTSNTQTGRTNPVSSELAQVKLQHHAHPVKFRNIWVLEK